MKDYYDWRHTPKFFEVGDMVNLRLHRDYTLPGITNRKTGQQFVGPLKVLERIRQLAYRLDIPAVWKIHPVISTAHLEPATNPVADPYQRPRLDHPGPVETKDNVEPTEDHYVVEKLLRKRISRGQTQYLVQWLGYGPEHDVWYDTRDLGSAAELIAEYERDHPRVLSNT